MDIIPAKQEGSTLAVCWTPRKAICQSIKWHVNFLMLTMEKMAIV